MVELIDSLKHRHLTAFETHLTDIDEDARPVMGAHGLTATARGNYVRAAVAAGWFDAETRHSGDIYTIDGVDIDEWKAEDVIALGNVVFRRYTEVITLSKKKS